MDHMEYKRRGCSESPIWACTLTRDIKDMGETDTLMLYHLVTADRGQSATGPEFSD